MNTWADHTDRRNPSNRRGSRGRLLTKCTFGLALALSLCVTDAEAQFGGRMPPELNTTLKEPVANRVYQRGRDNTAEIPVVLDKAPEGAKIVNVTLNGHQGETRFDEGKLRGVPTGSYSINVSIEAGTRKYQVTGPNIFVGDLWVLAGQSNMEGVGDLIDVTAPNEMVMALGMDGKWAKAT